MCAGAIYWANVRRIVFGLSLEQINAITATDPADMQLGLSSREVFARANHSVDVSGPHLPKESLAVHDGFWD
jgi:tRNA(adenine34) deaminase